MRQVILDFENNVDRKYNKYKKVFIEIMNDTLDQLTFQTGTYLVEVLLVEDARISELNLKTRGKNEVTDVLSFAYQNKATLESYLANPDAPLNLGSIVINALAAKRQAELYEHEVRREFKFLFVHGLLHLFGYDHATPEEEKIMIKLQNEIIGKRGS
ncbi:MAG TPA: rRNA maturation RNase YbeY [Bacilli bacterium]|nr:rRNA maturation RNase YbeY [Bacilli bacterium]